MRTHRLLFNHLRSLSLLHVFTQPAAGGEDAVAQLIEGIDAVGAYGDQCPRMDRSLYADIAPVFINMMQKWESQVAVLEDETQAVQLGGGTPAT
jgi:hypothetical protein